MAHTQKTKGHPAHWTDRIGRRIRLRDLHILLAVAKAGSMGRAANELAMSQPVVSKAIADLEHVLGVSLLDRSARGAEPTIYGRELLRCSVSVFDELRHGVEALQFLSDQSGGELHFGCTEGGAAGFAPAVIDALVAKYPRLRFNVDTADPASLVERLRQREIEFALGAAPDHTSDDIVLDTLFDERFVVMAGERNPWTKKRNIGLEDLLGERWILQPPNSIAGVHAAAAFRACGLEPPVAQVTSFSVPLTHQLLTTGQYLALVAVAMAKLARHLPVKRLDVRFVGFPRAIAIMTLKNRTISPLARLFIERAHAVARPFRALR